MTPRTKAGLVKFRPVEPGGRIALVAPASPFERAEFDAGVAELGRLGFDPVFDDSIFAREPIVAGPAERRAEALITALSRPDVDAVLAVRGGYGSAEVLPWLAASPIAGARRALVGYSDITALHAYLNCHVGVTSVHGAMIDGRLSKGPASYDPTSFKACLGRRPLGEMTAPALDVVRAGEATAPLFGGTLTQIGASLGTPYAFDPPAPYVLFIEDVGERPYRLRRILTQLAQSGRLSGAVAVVAGEMDRCVEPGGATTAKDVIAEFFRAFPGPVLFGFPSGHTTRPSLSVPLGVEVQVVGPARGRPVVVFREAAAG